MQLQSVVYKNNFPASARQRDADAIRLSPGHRNGFGRVLRLFLLEKVIR